MKNIRKCWVIKMESIDGKMNQEKFNELNAELTNLQMLQSLEYQEERKRKIEALKKEIGIEE